MKFRVIYSPKAESQLSNIFEYVCKRGGETVAAKFVSSIIDYCDGFETFPERGILRYDLREGLRIIGYRRRVTIAFAIDSFQIIILGIYYGGQDFESDVSVE